MNERQAHRARGPLAWMARNSVAANLIMAVMIIGGLLMAPTITREVFPEITLDYVTVRVPYPGAGPEEVEQGIVLAVEEAVRGVEGVKEIQSSASEGLGVVSAELYLTANEDRVLNDIKSAVDRITSLPLDAEEPGVSLLKPLREVVSIIVYGDIALDKLREYAEIMREELLNRDDITQVEIEGIPAPQMSIDIPLERLRAHDLTLQRIAGVIKSASVDMPGGAIETPEGEILLRTTEQRSTAEEFANITIIANPDGSRISVGDLGSVYEDYTEQDVEAYFNGERSVRLTAFRIGTETPTQVADAVRDYVAFKRTQLPEKLNLAIWDDNSEMYEERIGLLMKNGTFGLLFVLLILGLFLKVHHAFWVTVGMLASFCGSFLFMNALGVTINMISLFAFILVLGIVVDDAIVAGESIFNQRRNGNSPLPSAIAGVREVAVPIVFSVLTTVVAFGPILFVPGAMGKLFANIPLVVIPILLLSLFESLFILPAHLAHHEREPAFAPIVWFNHQQDKISLGLERWIVNWYAPRLRKLVNYRHITLSASLGVLIIALGLLGGGIIKYIFFPRIEGDFVTATIELPFGSSLQQTREVMNEIVVTAQSLHDSIRQAGNRDAVTGMYSLAGGTMEQGGPVAGGGANRANRGFVIVELAAANKRAFSAREFSQLWRRTTGEIPGVERLAFDFNIGPSGGAALAVQLSHANNDKLERAAERLAGRMDEYAGVFDIDDGYQQGKQQLDLKLLPGARALGITEADLGRQVRHAYFGAEATRQQRGRDELRVYVRLPRRQRSSAHSIDNMIIRTPRGGEVPLAQAAAISRSRSFTSIERINGRRVAEVTADVNPSVTNAEQIYASLTEDALPELKRDFPGLSYERAGQQEQLMESMNSLGRGMLIALMIMYGLMAMAFRSYLQPLIVMSAIPFGIVGAFIGHLIMGYQLSLISMLGIVALAGVVVNDSLILIVAVNENRRNGMQPVDAVVAGGQRRFRPVLLTSLTTFFGLSPMIFETSLQARFLIPMALSLGFGVLFVTVIALVIVPSAYLALEDVKRLLSRKTRQRQ
ncbi:MAG: AcrB/AcrD/AcrF family protein [Chitinivibrionales bacterium]|nr:AcrB/AcrD/AcrF family protein [Chitinivibrionales bacterium]